QHPGRPQVRHLLERHEAAPGRRRGAAQGPGSPHPRRAHQRPRPPRDGRDAQAHQGHRPGRAHGAPLEPTPRRGRADLLPGRRHRAPTIREIAGGSLLPAHRRKAEIMIATIKAEWRKSRLRPGFLIGAGVIAGIAILVYAANWYLALHPLATRGGERPIVSLATLYPDQFVNNVMGAAFPIGAAVAIVLGALFAGSEYGWGTVKTMFTQRPGRLTVWG